MGSDFAERMTPAEAAKRLHRSRRTVTTYIKSGVLRTYKDGNSSFLLREDVEQLALELGAGFPPMNRKTFYSLCAHVQRLEMDVAVLKKMAGVIDSPMRPSQEEAEGLFMAASKAAADGVWEEREVQMWADLYEKMDDVFFDILTERLGRADAWRPFYELCLAQAKQVSIAESYATSIQAQHLHDRLSVGLSRMRKVILVWVEAGNSVAAQRAEAKMDGDAQAVLKRLIAKA